jgi:hypothetical protein
MLCSSICVIFSIERAEILKRIEANAPIQREKRNAHSDSATQTSKKASCKNTWRQKNLIALTGALYAV